MSGILEDFQALSTEFYPGSKKPIIRDPKPSTDQPDPDRWDAKPQVYKVGGVDREFFSVGQLATALGGRRPVTIRKWERIGIIPKPTFRKPSDDPRGQRRLYTREQVEGMVEIAQEEGILTSPRRPINKTRFTERVIDLFRELSR